jgi:hypothetical protein
MSNDVWEAGKDVMDLVHHYIANHHPNLAMVDGDIAVLFRTKATKKGGQVVLGTSRKSPSILDVLGKATYKFIMEIASDEWTLLSNAQQGALIDHLLCACRVEEDPKSGEAKFSIAPPDVQFYWGELERNGDWRPRPQQEAGASMDIEEMIGGKTESKPGGKPSVVKKSKKAPETAPEMDESSDEE